MKVICLARKKGEKGVSTEACADMIEESPDTTRRLYQLMEIHPDWKDEQIYEELFGIPD